MAGARLVASGRSARTPVQRAYNEAIAAINAAINASINRFHKHPRRSGKAIHATQRPIQADDNKIAIIWAWLKNDDGA